MVGIWRVFRLKESSKVHHGGGVFVGHLGKALSPDEVERYCTLRVSIHDTDTHAVVQAEILGKMRGAQTFGGPAFLACKQDDGQRCVRLPPGQVVVRPLCRGCQKGPHVHQF